MPVGLKMLLREVLPAFALLQGGVKDLGSSSFSIYNISENLGTKGLNKTFKLLEDGVSTQPRYLAKVKGFRDILFFNCTKMLVTDC